MPLGEHPPESSQLVLRVLQTTDLHAQLFGHDYLRDVSLPDRGLARLMPQIATAQAGADNSLLFDTGDFMFGTPLGDDPEMGAVASITAMNALPYDAGTLGNHEFDHGLPALRAALAGLRFPIVASSLALPDDLPNLHQRLILTRTLRDTDGRPHEVRIGLLGLAPPQITKWTRFTCEAPIAAQQIVASAQQTAHALREDGADLVIALSHSGPGDGTPKPDLEQASTLVAALPEIDVVLAGHAHGLWPPRGAETPDPQHSPMVMAGSYGSHLGLVDLVLTRRDGAWQTDSATARLIAATDDSAPPAEAEARLPDVVQQMHQRTRRRMNDVIAETRGLIHSGLTPVTSTGALSLVAGAFLAEARRLLADDPALSGLPLLAAVSAFQCGGHGGPTNFVSIPPGPLRRQHLAQLAPHPDRLVVLEITGAGLRDWLEQCASIFAQVLPGQRRRPLLSHPIYSFDVLHGLRYKIDLSTPARFGDDGKLRPDTPGRIRDLTLAGAPIAPDARVLVAASGHRAAGVAPITASAGLLRATSAQGIPDLIAAHFRAQTPLTPTPEPVWAFTPVPGASIELQLDPRRNDAGPEAPGLPWPLRPLGLDAEGFALYEMGLDPKEPATC